MRHEATGRLLRTLPLLLGLGCAPPAPVVDVLAPADTPDTVGPYEVSVLVEDSDRVVEARVHWFVDEDGPAPRPLTLERVEKSERWRAGLPGQPVGTEVRLYVEITTDDGLRVRSPESPELLSFSVLGPH